MPIQQYSDLTSAVGDFLNRQDLTAVIPTFIQFAESDFNRTLRVCDMIVLDASISFLNPTAPMPPDFLELKGSPYIPGVVSLEYKTPEVMNEDLALQPNWYGNPNFYTILGQQMKVMPTPTGPQTSPPTPFVTVNFSYYQQIPSLITASTNWLLSRWPDLYLYSSLVQSAPYLKDDDRVQVWNGYRTKILEDVHEADERASYRGATPRINISVGGAIGG